MVQPALALGSQLNTGLLQWGENPRQSLPGPRTRKPPLPHRALRVLLCLQVIG
jgi:hypothetical protein